ncbi:MAG: glutathione S-transferase [Hyphomicrobium sp.]
MKIYDWHIAPNPRRLHIYVAEKGLNIPLVEVGTDQLTLSGDYVSKYPHAMVPMLELDDGTRIGEAMAIARYLEELYPDPPLFGVDARDRALVDMWEKRANEEGMLAASELFRNTAPAFADRGLPGSAEPVRQVPELVVRAKERMARFYRKFDGQLAGKEFVTGDRYTVADITTLCAIDFGKWTDLDIPPECSNLRRWYDAVSARPSAKV